MTYAERLKDPRWQKKRLEVLERDAWACYHCGDTKSTLHVHHEAYIGKKPWETPDECLTTLCDNCHSILHSLTELEQLLYKCIVYRTKNEPDTLEHLQRLNKIIKEFKDNPNQKCII